MDPGAPSYIGKLITASCNLWTLISRGSLALGQSRGLRAAASSPSFKGPRGAGKERRFNSEESWTRWMFPGRPPQMVCDICSFTHSTAIASPLDVWSGQDTCVSEGLVGGGGGWRARELAKCKSLETRKGTGSEMSLH